MKRSTTTIPSAGTASFVRPRHHYRRCNDRHSWCDNHHHFPQHINHARMNRDENGDSAFDNKNDKNNKDDDDDDMTSKNRHVLRQRMYPLQVATLEQMYQRSLPISPSTTTTTTTMHSNGHTRHDPHHSNSNHYHPHHHPIPFIEFCLHCLLHNDTPYPDSGIRFLLRVSTKAWREQIYRSIGHNAIRKMKNKTNRKQSTMNDNVAAPMEENDTDENDEEEIVTAISAAISQLQNQFGILVGEGEPYRICFPSEPLEYEDEDTISTIPIEHSISNGRHSMDVPNTPASATVWIECQLRHYDTNELLVMMGWQLRVIHQAPTLHHQQGRNHRHHRAKDEYQIDRVDWQDFRDMFRPGIGREEWVRICG